MTAPSNFLQIFSAYIPATEKLLREYQCTLQGYPLGHLYISTGFVCYYVSLPAIYIVIPIKTIRMLQKGAFCLVVVQPERTSQFVMETSLIESAYSLLQSLLPGAQNTCAHCGRLLKNNACTNCTAAKTQLIREVPLVLANSSGGKPFQ